MNYKIHHFLTIVVSLNNTASTEKKKTKVN